MLKRRPNLACRSRIHGAPLQAHVAELTGGPGCCRRRPHQGWHVRAARVTRVIELPFHHSRGSDRFHPGVRVPAARPQLVSSIDLSLLLLD